MARFNKVDGMLTELDKFREDENWNDFFESIEKVRTLDSEINDEMHNDPSDTTELDKKVKSEMHSLEQNKEKYAGLTKTKSEYDAVFDVVSEINDEFGHLK